MIVAARASKRESEKRRARRVHRVGEPLVFELRGHQRGIQRDRADSVERCGSHSLRVVRPQFVARDLFLDETVEWFVGIERGNDVNAILPGVLK